MLRNRYVQYAKQVVRKQVVLVLIIRFGIDNLDGNDTIIEKVPKGTKERIIWNRFFSKPGTNHLELFL